MTSTTSNERITRDDIKAKLTEIQGEATTTANNARNQILAVGVAVGVAVVVIAFALGRRGGRRRSTVIEISRN